MMMKPSDAIKILMNGVDSWSFSNTEVPCELLLIGEAAFPVLVNGKGQVLIAASQYGKGRMVVLAHEGYMYYTSLTQFFHNAVGWLNGCPCAAVGVHSSAKGLISILSSSCVKVESTDYIKDSLGVFCMSAYDATMAKQVIQFVKNGGGLLIGGQAWHWASQQSQNKVLSDFPGNQITSVAGVYFTDTYGDISYLKVSKEVPLSPLLVRFGEDLSEDQKQLLEGISELNFSLGGVPSQLLVHGALAFPLGLDNSLGCFLAAARYGRGRVVLVAHEDILWEPKLAPFLCNAVRWLAGDQKGKIGINPEVKDLGPLLSNSCLERDIVPHVTTDLSVYCCHTYKDHEVEQLHEFVAEGGGLLIGGQAWWWASQNPCQIPVADYPGNRILNTFGLSILDQTLEKHSITVLCPKTRNYHLRLALSQVLNGQGGSLAEGWLAKLKKDCEAFLKMPAEEIPNYVSLQHFIRMFENM